VNVGGNLNESESSTSLIVDRIVEEFHPRRVVRFGSRARGTATAESDVDLLVFLDRVADKRDAAIEIRRAFSDLPVCKDVIVTTPDEIARRGDLTGSVLRPALREGKVVYEQP
jgi:predicted nucleotidyltransferase